MNGVNRRELMNLTLRIWRQASPVVEGKFETYSAYDISPDTSFLEMLDVVNERLTLEGQSRLRSILIVERGSAARAAS